MSSKIKPIKKRRVRCLALSCRVSIETKEILYKLKTEYGYSPADILEWATDNYNLIINTKENE